MMGATITTAFAPSVSRSLTRLSVRQAVVLQATSDDASSKPEQDKLPDIATMKLGDMRQELESYGISTRSFLEKPEFVDALTTARAEGKRPKKQTSTSSSSGTQQSTSNSESSGRTRQEKIKEETAKAKAMSVGELRKELTNRGIKTNSFFEKSDFVKAYAEAVVDGVRASSSGSGGSRARTEEKFDPSYRDVQTSKLDPSTKRMLQGTVIDIRPKS